MDEYLGHRFNETFSPNIQVLDCGTHYVADPRILADDRIQQAIDYVTGKSRQYPFGASEKLKHALRLRRLELGHKLP